MNYKKIIKSQSFRFRILRSFSWASDKTMAKLQYKIKLGRKPYLNDFGLREPFLLERTDEGNR